MTHLPIDPLSCIALALLCVHGAANWLGRRRQRGHLARFLRSAAEVARHQRGAP